jgi:hypothetical protein
MKKLILLLTTIVTTLHCNGQTKLNEFQSEVEKWKTELLINGEVGPPCTEDYEKWSEENPDYYWGMQEVKSKTFDINTDGVNDGLFYFPAENCVGGNGQGSDFAILIYSHNGIFLTNKNISETIEDKIKIEFTDKEVYEVSNTNIHYENLNKTIEGTFWTWRNEDAACCPSLSGTFEYNPFDFKVTLKYIDEKKK